MTENSQQLPSENIPLESPFGIKNPLLSRSPLGQKFLQPLGSKSISVLDRSLFSDQGGELQPFSDEDSPFLVKSKPNLGSEAIIQEKPLSPLNINPSQVTEFNSDQTSDRESDSSQTPELDFPTPEDSQIRREPTSSLEENSKNNSDAKTTTKKPYFSNSTPSKSTVFREILGEESPPTPQKKKRY